MDFYISLVGQTSSFYHKLPVPVDVEGYEVSVVQSQFPGGRWHNFPETDVHIIKNKDNDNATIATIPGGHYTTYALLKQMESVLKLTIDNFDPSTFMVNLKCPKQTEYIFPDNLRDFCGLLSNRVKGKVHGITMAVQKTICLIADFIDPQHVNSRSLRMIKIMPTFHYKQYFRVNKTMLSELSIEVVDFKNLEPMYFVKGDIVIVLHFRKVNK